MCNLVINLFKFLRNNGFLFVILIFLIFLLMVILRNFKILFKGNNFLLLKKFNGVVGM